MTLLLTDEQVEEIKKREKSATKGPWPPGVLSSHSLRISEKGNHFVDERLHACGPGHSYEDDENTNELTIADTEFVANARQDIPSLLADRDEFKRRLNIAEKTIFWAYEYMKNYACDKECDSSVDFHQPECCIVRDFEKALIEIRREE